MIRIFCFTLIATTGWGQTVISVEPTATQPSEERADGHHAAIEIQGNGHEISGGMLHAGTVSGPTMVRQPSSYLIKKKKRPERYGFFGWSAGMWIPTGHNRILGAHPAIGCAGGMWSDQWLLELRTELRFGDAANSYNVVYRDTLRRSQAYLGAYLGIHIGYGILNFKNTSVYLLSGCGYDGFTAIYEADNDDENDTGLTIRTLSLDAGLGMQHFRKKGGFWGIELLYSQLRYSNPGGSALDGNAVTLRVTYGRISGF